MSKRDQWDEQAERLLPVITEFGNAEFQCGSWQGDDLGYNEWKAQADGARANLLSAVATELRKQGQRIAELEGALKAVAPWENLQGVPCYCGEFRGDEEKHSDDCQQARAALGE